VSLAHDVSEAAVVDENLVSAVVTQESVSAGVAGGGDDVCTEVVRECDCRQPDRGGPAPDEKGVSGLQI